MITEFAGLPLDDGTILVILLGLGLSVLIGVLVVFFIPVMEIARFVHPIAYVKSTGTPFVERGEIYPLAEAADPGELLAVLRARSVLGDMPPDAADLRRHLAAWHMQRLADLQQAAPLSVGAFIEAAAMEFEIDTLKRAIMRKHLDSAPAGLEDELLPAGRMDPAALRRIAEAAGMEEVADIVAGAPYGRAFLDALPEYLADWRVMPLSAALDRFFYAGLRQAVFRSPQSLREPLAFYVGARIDRANAATVLSAKVAGTCRDEVVEHLIPGGLALDPNLLEHMADAPSIPDALAVLEGTRYWPVVAPLVPAYETENDIVAIISALEASFLEYAAILGGAYPLTVGPLLEHMAGLAYERRNLHVVLTGVLTGVPPERIKRLLIVREAAA
ncbi:V-type ATPase subunit [Methanoculleus sp.]|uniref:V-type ATPase subunit n=1 Tax=Methanoculleus sp. TaxID=90427 RepID=UPI001BD44011|nr:V-type ATPase subunit [Methanoculleus sp.]